MPVFKSISATTTETGLSASGGLRPELDPTSPTNNSPLRSPPSPRLPRRMELHHQRSINLGVSPNPLDWPVNVGTALSSRADSGPTNPTIIKYRSWPLSPGCGRPRSSRSSRGTTCDVVTPPLAGSARQATRKPSTCRAVRRHNQPVPADWVNPSAVSVIMAGRDRSLAPCQRHERWGMSLLFGSVSHGSSNI